MANPVRVTAPIGIKLRIEKKHTHQIYTGARTNNLHRE